MFLRVLMSICVSVYFLKKSQPKHLLRVAGLEEHVQITLIFARIISFMLFTVLLSLLYFILKSF
jgi:hypothetical protein